jgi:MYXO-CTERM domain-containing protein
VTYQVWDRDPTLDGAIEILPGTEGANVVSADVSIEAVPEPSMMGCGALALGLLALWQRRTGKRSANRV